MSSLYTWSSAILREKPDFLKNEPTLDVSDFPSPPEAIRRLEELLRLSPERHPYILVRLALGYNGLGALGVAYNLFEEAEVFLYKKKVSDTSLQEVLKTEGIRITAEIYHALRIDTSLNFFQTWKPAISFQYPLNMPYPTGHRKVQEDWHALFVKDTELWSAYLRALAIQTNHLDGTFLIEDGSSRDIVRRGIANGVVESIPKQGLIEDAQDIKSILNDTLAAYDFLANDAQLNRVTPETVCTVHRKLMNTAGYLVLPIVPGGYTRRVTTKTAVIQTMEGPIQCCSCFSVDEELAKICQRTSAILAYDSDNNDFANPFGLASWLHVVLARCHPFNDGNGRTTRMIASIPLIHAGYPPIAINLSQRADYLSAINKAYDDDFQSLADCICEGMKDTIQSVRDSMAA